jgi:hypothetical protein
VLVRIQNAVTDVVRRKNKYQSSVRSTPLSVFPFIQFIVVDQQCRILKLRTANVVCARTANYQSITSMSFVGERSSSTDVYWRRVGNTGAMHNPSRRTLRTAWIIANSSTLATALMIEFLCIPQRDDARYSIPCQSAFVSCRFHQHQHQHTAVSLPILRLSSP